MPCTAIAVSVSLYVDNHKPRPPSGSLTDTLEKERTFDSFKKKGIKFLFNFPCGEACFLKEEFGEEKKKSSGGSQEENGDHVIITHLCHAMVLILEHKQQVGKIKQQGCGKRDPIKVSWHRV